MADNTTYHKLEHIADISLDNEEDDPVLSSIQKSYWGHLNLHGWLRLLCEGLLVLTVLALSLEILIGDGRSTSGRNEPQEDFGYIDLLFMNDSLYASKEAFMSQQKLDETLAQWVPLSSKGRGYVRIPAEERDRLDGPPYLIDPLLRHHQKEAYMLSGLHQLHCLATIMSSYGRLNLGNNESEMTYHIAHCFDYLRQGILCAADSTLEGNNTIKYPGVEVPWGTAHRCRNWDALREWADERTIWPFPPGIGVL